MDIILNNNKEHIEAEHFTVRQLLEFKNFTFKMLVIRINGQVVKKEAYSETLIRDGDHVSVLHLMSGG